MAANRDMVAQLVLKLRDGISTGLLGLQRRLAGLAGIAGRVGIGFGALAGLSFLGPIQQAAAFEDVLRQNAITAGRSGLAAEQMIRATQVAYEGLALRTGQLSKDIASAAGQLVAANLPEELVDQFLPVLSRTATATGASLTDLSSTAIALNQNLGITGAQQMADALGALAVAGKEGRFELRDMAQYMPTLAAAAQALGLNGREAANSLAAMLQVARRGSGTSQEAANNLANFLQKITSPETVKNFREMGVDLEAVMKDAARKGLNPIEVMVEKIRSLTQGDQFKVGKLFGDLQVLNFLRPALANTREYLRILELAREASDQVISTDFETRSRGMLIRLQLIEERLTQIGRRFTMSLGSATLGPLDTALKTVQSGIEALDARFPGLIDTLVAGGAAVAALVAGLGALAIGMAAVTGGFAAIGGAPGLAVVAVLAAIGAAATSLVQNWEPLKAEWREIGQRWKADLEDFAIWLDGWVNRIGDQTVGRIRAAWSSLSGFFDGLWSGITARFNSALTGIQSAPALAGAGAGGGPATQRFGGRGSAEGFYGPQGRVRVELGLPPGVTARTTDASPNVEVAPVNRGNTLGRP